jgi:hypothetical protein
VFGWIGSLIRGLWGFARASHIDPGNGLRPGSGAAAIYLFLVLVFGVIGLVLVGLGFDLDEVDAWLARQGGWLDAAGSLAFKALLAGLLLVALLLVGGGLHGSWRRLIGGRGPGARGAKGRAAEAEAAEMGPGSVLAGLVLGYFAAVGLLG